MNNKVVGGPDMPFGEYGVYTRDPLFLAGSVCVRPMFLSLLTLSRLVPLTGGHMIAPQRFLLRRVVFRVFKRTPY